MSVEIVRQGGTDMQGYLNRRIADAFFKCDILIRVSSGSVDSLFLSFQKKQRRKECFSFFCQLGLLCMGRAEIRFRNNHVHYH